MLIWETGRRNCSRMITASSDYSVRFHALEDGNCGTWELYRHRAAVTSMTQINNLVLTISNDMYLKYYSFSDGTPPNLTSSSFYAFQATPTQLACVNESSIVVGSVNGLNLFDLNKC